MIGCIVAKKKMGRIPKSIDWKLLEKLCALRLDLVDCAELMGGHDKTLHVKIKEKYNQTFTEYRNQKLAVTRRSLVTEALNQALRKNNTAMLIFCLKNLCGWENYIARSDVKEPASRVVQQISLNYSLPSDPNRNKGVIDGEATTITSDD